MSAVAIVAAAVAPIAGGASAALAASLRMKAAQRARRKERALAFDSAGGAQPIPAAGASESGRRQIGLRYARSMTRQLYAGETVALSPRVRAGRAERTRAGAWFAEHMALAGCSKDVSVPGYCEAGFRLACAAAMAGALFGMVFSTELAILLAIAGGLFGGSLPRRAVREAMRERRACAERHLSEMLEVVGLGMRSGLTFERSFALYGSHFDNGFSRSCARAHRSWSLGLVTRDEALRELARSYDCDQLAHVVESIIRSLRFGSALADVLSDAAEQARASYRTALEEKVAKAPVKMMLPTGTLILPAMLLLVMGPILLELAGGF